MTLANQNAASNPSGDEIAAQLRGLPPPAYRRAVRRSAGLTLNDVAAALGVDPMTISRWERGLAVPWRHHRLAYLRALAEMDRIANTQK